MRLQGRLVLCALPVILAAGILVGAQDKKEPAEQERSVKEAEVPPAALAALKKLAGGATFIEFAEEIEHGHKFYEGSWKGPDGNVDALVTESGDLVEVEEAIPAEKVPKNVRVESAKAAGKEGAMTFEKKTMVLYEIHFKKEGKEHEAIFTPDGRRHEEVGEMEQGDKDDDKPE